MRISHRLAIAIAMSFSAMAVTATAATAQVFVAEEGGAPCNPCVVHLEGESHIRAMPAGVIVSRCHDELTATINSDGFGELRWVGTTDNTPGCNVVNCTSIITGEDGLVEAHWPLVVEESILGGGLLATIRVCLRAGTAELHCDVGLLVYENLPTGSHSYLFKTFELGASCAAGARILVSDWDTEHNGGEGDQEVEVAH